MWLQLIRNIVRFVGENGSFAAEGFILVVNKHGGYLFILV